MIIWMTTLAFFFANPTPAAGESLMGDVKWDAIEVTRCVKDYIEGTMTGNKAQIRSAFLPNAGLQLIRDGKHQRYTREQYVNFFEEGRTYNRPGRLVSADITGNAAMVKVEIHMRERRYTDYLLLLKVDGAWKIAEKIATNAPLNQLQ